jgi:cysteine synthase A
MSASNPLNVYTGPDSLQKYYDPDIQPPLPLVEVPASLNPFYADGVRIYAKMMSMHPANNVKALPGAHTPHPYSLSLLLSPVAVGQARCRC